MPLHAIDDIGDAIDATKAFLFPFAARTWLKLAFVVLFIGGGGGGFNGLQNAGNFGGQDQPSGNGFDQPVVDEAPTTVDGVVSAVGTEILAVLAVVILLALLFGLLSNFMEFVFVESLVSREVHVLRYFRENVGNGIRLFLFRAVVSLVALSLTGLFLYGLFVTVFDGSLANITPAAVLGSLPLLVGFFLVMTLVQGLTTGFTNAFVVPMMLTSDRGLLGSWRRLLSSMRANLKQYVVYVFFSVVLGIGVGIIGSVLGVIFALLIAIPFVLLAALCFLALGSWTATTAALVIIGVLFAVLLLLVTNLIKVPLQSFMRYYAMFVLGDIDESLDPIPDVRADIRPAEPDEGPAFEDA